MKTILEEARTTIPKFDEIWSSIQQAIVQRMSEKRPSSAYGFQRWQLNMYNIKAPKGAFYDNLTLHLDLYLAPSTSLYKQISKDFTESEVSPNMSIARNGKIGNISMKIRIATSQRKLFYDILPEIYHELTHAFDYYQKLRNNPDTVNLQGDSAYDVRALRTIMNSNRFSSLEKNLAVFFYFIDPEEYQGRLNSFYGELKNTKVVGRDVDKVIKQTKVWKNVVFLYNVVYYMNKVTTPADQKKLLTIANIMNNRSSSGGYAKYDKLLQDVTNKYNELRDNTYRDFAEIVQEFTR